jgi:hypothetical protein
LSKFVTPLHQTEDTMFNRFLRAIAMLDSGLPCRTCGEGIKRDDEFGLSEGVCAPCRD